MSSLLPNYLIQLIFNSGNWLKKNIKRENLFCLNRKELKILIERGYSPFNWSTAPLHTNINMISSLAESNLVKLEKSYTVIHPPTVSVHWTVSKERISAVCLCV